MTSPQETQLEDFTTARSFLADDAEYTTVPIGTAGGHAGAL